MQDTRFSNLLSASARQLSGWLQNPWRRTSIQIIALFGGFFLATAIATTAGQAALWDLPAAAVLVLICEAISSWIYRRSPQGRVPFSLGFAALNLLKVGFTYGLFVEAFKLGS